MPPGPTILRKEVAVQEVPVRRLALGVSGLAALTYALIVLGALVRANGAGLACPDWPLCFGELVPRFDVKVAFEWSHRLLAGSISLCFLALAVASLRPDVARRTIGRLLAIGGALLVVQILLGALTVWRLLAVWTVTSHLLVGNAFAVTLALSARSLFRAASPDPPATSPAVPRALRATLTVAAGLLGAQVLLGGLVSSTYAGLACPEWPTCVAGRWFPSFEGALGLQLLHRLGAYALVVALAGSAWLSRGVPQLRGLLASILALVLTQVAVGVSNVWLRLPVEVTGLHSALAAALVLTMSLALARAWQRA
jgi:cytochrome c oxidase assembly protein subunit 15